MNRFSLSLCASTLTASLAVTGVAGAIPMPVANMHNDPTDVQKVQGEWWMGGSRNPVIGGGWRGGGNWNGANWNRGPGWNGGWHGGGWNRGWHGGGWHNNDFWFPLGAFATGAILGGVLASQPAYRHGGGYRGGSAHEQWCYNRFRSYRSWDNTFQPNNGPRRQCISPYG